MKEEQKYRHYLDRICELVETDRAEEWCWKSASKKPFTQEEAREMANIIGSVYLHAHKIHCTACALK